MTLAHPKPQKTPKAPRKPMRKQSPKRQAYRASRQWQDALRYMEAVKSLPCAVCGRAGPSDAHHWHHDRYSQARTSDWQVVPLCKEHHQDGHYSVHSAKAGFRELWGPDWGFVSATRQMVRERFGIVAPEDELFNEGEMLERWF